MVGAELTFALAREVKRFEKKGALRLLLGCRATALQTDAAGAVVGVAYTDAAGGSASLLATDTVLATGGFANDRSDTSLLEKHRPDLLRFPTTNGPWATGDGMKMAMAIGAGTVDMDRVQVHPTGFLDPADLAAPAKVLCGEMMRGVGGVLLSPEGRRFVDELRPRDKVVEAELATGASEFTLLLNGAMAAEAGRHLEHYAHKGLLVKLQGTPALARWMVASADGADKQTAEQAVARAAAVDAAAAAAVEATLNATLEEYAAAAAAGGDVFGKTVFPHAPLLASAELWAGRIVPVLHYTMGGITFAADGAVLSAAGERIGGLHAAGEVTGGVHGNNRLGGNSLLECTVFGSIVGNKLAAKAAEARRARDAASTAAASAPAAAAVAAPASVASPAAAAADFAAPSDGGGAASEPRAVSASELKAHGGCGEGEPCWVGLYGRVYDFASFLDEHPAGPTSISDLGGADGTVAFEHIHNEAMLSEFDDVLIGRLEA